MKKKLMLSSLFVLLSLVVNAQYQDWGTGKVYKKDGTVLEGLVRFYYFDDGVMVSNEKMRYKTERNKPSKKIAAKDVDSITFKTSYTKKIKGKRVKKTKNVTFISIPKNKKKTKFGYAELVVDGEVKLLKRSYVDSRTTQAKNQFLFLRKGDFVRMLYSIKSFRKEAIKYFSDCPALCAKLENKTFKRKDVVKIVTFYNNNCSTD